MADRRRPTRSNVVDLAARRRELYVLTPDEKYFDSIVHALQELTPAARIEAIASSCDPSDWQMLAGLAEFLATLAEPDPAA
jgi:hypothetical protein